MLKMLFFYLLDWILAKATMLFSVWKKQKDVEEKIKAEVKEQIDKLKNAGSEDARAKATEDIARDTF